MRFLIGARIIKSNQKLVVIINLNLNIQTN
jgi:hypothetical protein